MKFVTLLLCLAGSTAFADLTVLSSPIQGVAVSGPNGLFQVEQPRIVPQLGSTFVLKGDDNTAKAICSFAGKSLVKYTTTIASTNVGGYKFDSDGVMSYLMLEDNDLFINTVICK